MLYTETNTVVGIGKGQDPVASSLIFGPPRSFRLAIPAICCMEALSVYKREKKQRNKIRDGLDAQAHEARRDLMSLHSRAFTNHLTQAILEFEESSGEIGERLIRALQQLASVAEIIPLDPNVLQESLRNQFTEDPTDNLILHCILDHARKAEAGPKAFVSDNHKDFGQASAKAAMLAAGIRYFSKVEHATGWLGTQASP